MNKICTIIILTLWAPMTATAIVFGGSNLGILGYSEHDCIKPYKPTEPYSFDSQWEVDLYNSQVDTYNFELDQYISCIREYVENANNDIERIKEKYQNAIDEASN